MAEAITFTDAEGNVHVIQPMAQGLAVPADAEALAKDAVGYTHPNLHRRIQATDRELPELSPRYHELIVGGVNSYRYAKINLHDDSSTDTEVP